MRFDVDDDVLFVFGGDGRCRLIRDGLYVAGVGIAATSEVISFDDGIADVKAVSICVEKVVEIWEKR